MSVHKLTAGSGYDYLTRQVAALDATEKGHTGLASYYAERGESSGVWIGSGMDGIDGLAAGDPVTAEQMRALFGCGLHPLAELRQQHLEGPDLTDQDFQNVARLGVPFKIVDNDLIPFRVEVAKRIAALNTAIGWPANASIAAADRARVRTQVAREFFRAEHGREPVTARELAGQIAKDSRPRMQTVAGYDLTFSPVKSVSTLWALAEPAVAAVIERAHQDAVKEALTFIETHALFTRTGPQGIRQVNVRGLVAAAFTHRDSRAGDPDLHTHVAVANKVQTLDGRWLSIDGRVLFKANVAASETYNTALEQHLRDTLGVRFAERSGTDPTKRPIREIVGVDPRLNQRWSTRRAHINTRRGELAIQFQQDHGRPPTPVEALHLAQQATLETRDAKHEPRSLTEQRATLDLPLVEMCRYEADGTATVIGATGEHPFQPGTNWPVDGLSLTALVRRTQRPARIDDYADVSGKIGYAAREAGVHAGVGAPVVVDGRVWGVVSAGGGPSVRLPPKAEGRLSQFTELLATAIANAQAREELHRLADEQSALRRLATLVARGAQPAVVFDAVCQETGRLFEVSSVNLAHFTSDGYNLTMAGWSIHDVHLPTGTVLPFGR
jgi:conjugative relaxase-like TrwC/TraI family protein